MFKFFSISLFKLLFELIFGFIIFSKTRGVFLIRHLTYITPFKGGIDSSINISLSGSNSISSSL